MLYIIKATLLIFNLFIWSKTNINNRFIENKKNLNINDFYKIMSLNWNKEDESLRNEYKKIAESDHRRFHIELKQFKKLGYYFKIDATY